MQIQLLPVSQKKQKVCKTNPGTTTKVLNIKTAAIKALYNHLNVAKVQ